MTEETVNRTIHAACTKEPWTEDQDYCRSRNLLAWAEKTLCLHDRNNVGMRVAWINAVRDEVAPRCPKNKVGAPLVSDVDVMLATNQERATGLAKALQKLKPAP